MKTFVPLEHDEAVALATYLEILVTTKKIVCFSHIPQETFTKNWGTKMKNKREGVHTGVPDYLIITPTKILFIELKRSKGGTISIEQKNWINALNTTGKARAIVARGFLEAKAFIDSETCIDLSTK